MKKSILFIATYPVAEKQKEGMFQRIKAIDTEFEAYNRTYLSISYTSHWKKKETIYGNVKIIYVNWFLHFAHICKIIREKHYIYIHSLYNSKFIIGIPLKGKNITLDLHGSVPEELEYYDKKLKSLLYNEFERIACKYVTNLICVSYAMADYYKRKRKLDKKVNIVIKPIYPINSISQPEVCEVDSLRKSLNIKDTNIVFMYSGNLQKWQNFDLMMQCIKGMNNPNYRFIILTQEVEKANEFVSNLPNSDSIIVKSVLPKDLSLYYTIAHYGFILRDDIILNRVAAPTKLIEYLSYGLIPIVKTINIGDSIKMGYEYISYQDELSNLTCRKSIINENIAKSVIKLNAENNIPHILFSQHN